MDFLTLSPARTDRAPQRQCPICNGCGHICTRCGAGITTCRCDESFNLDTEEIAVCRLCSGTGLTRVEPHAKA